MIYEFNNPIPVITEHGKGYIWYVRDNGSFENDVFAIILCNGGLIKHYTSKQFVVEKNGTFEIENHELKKSKTATKIGKKNGKRETARRGR